MKKKSPARPSARLSLGSVQLVSYQDHDGLWCRSCGFLTIIWEPVVRALPEVANCIGCGRPLRPVFVKREGESKKVYVRPERHVHTKSWRGRR